MCLICGHVGCGRYQDRHAWSHYVDSTHSYAMELETSRIWDYAGDQVRFACLDEHCARRSGDVCYVSRAEPADPQQVR